MSSEKGPTPSSAPLGPLSPRPHFEVCKGVNGLDKIVLREPRGSSAEVLLWSDAFFFFFTLRFDLWFCWRNLFSVISVNLGLSRLVLNLIVLQFDLRLLFKGLDLCRSWIWCLVFDRRVRIVFLSIKIDCDLRIVFVYYNLREK